MSDPLKVATPKEESDEHGGTLTPDYVRYGLRDVQTTWECFDNLARRFATFGLNETGLHELYSEASLGKAYLGKTTLLKAMWAAADPMEAELGYSARLKFSSGRAVLQCSRNATPISSEVEFSAGEVRSGNKIPFDCFHLDPWILRRR